MPLPLAQAGDFARLFRLVHLLLLLLLLLLLINLFFFSPALVFILSFGFVCFLVTKLCLLATLAKILSTSLSAVVVGRGRRCYCRSNACCMNKGDERSISRWQRLEMIPDQSTCLRLLDFPLRFHIPAQQLFVFICRKLLGSNHRKSCWHGVRIRVLASGLNSFCLVDRDSGKNSQHTHTDNNQHADTRGRR